MLELPEFNNPYWFLGKIKKVFVHKNTSPQNYDKYYKKNTEDINKTLANILVETDFSDYQGRPWLEELVLASFDDLKMIYERLKERAEELFLDAITDEKGNSKIVIKKEWEILYAAYDKLVNEKINMELIEQYGIKCCPYCNENYISNRDQL